jgi:hypothetical protein
MGCLEEICLLGSWWGKVLMVGEHFPKYATLNKTTFQRHTLLQEWIGGALPGEHWEGLSVEGWFMTAQMDGRFIWAPAPSNNYVKPNTFGHGVVTFLFAPPL